MSEPMVNCADCGTALIFCAHAVDRIATPALAFQEKVLSEVRGELAAAQERIAVLEGALRATMRRFDRNGKPCWCPHIFDDRVFHISDCERARAALARAGQQQGGVTA